MKVWRCPYCGKVKPDGYEPTQWGCCGEWGHAELEEEDELAAVASGNRNTTGDRA